MVPLIPKLRGQFAEFLNNASLAHLRILSSSTCVGLRYGYLIQCLQTFLAISFLIIRYFILHYIFRYESFLFLAYLPLLCHLHLLSITQCRNFYLLSIGYAFRPLLRSRLTLGGRTFPRKPQTFDGIDSHYAFATYSGILSSISSTYPFSYASSLQNAPLPLVLSFKHKSANSVYSLAPVIFRATSLDQ